MRPMCVCIVFLLLLLCLGDLFCAGPGQDLNVVSCYLFYCSRPMAVLCQTTPNPIIISAIVPNLVSQPMPSCQFKDMRTGVTYSPGAQAQTPLPSAQFPAPTAPSKFPYLSLSPLLSSLYSKTFKQNWRQDKNRQQPFISKKTDR